MKPEILEFDHIQACKCRNLALFRCHENGIICYVCPECFLVKLMEDTAHVDDHKLQT
jgi:hypothetical protein